jgi:hypothetical protein
MDFQNAIILFEDYIQTATLSGGSWSSDFPLDNVKDDDVGLPARSSDATSASTVINIDLLAQKQVDVLVAGPLNVSRGAQYQFTSYEDSGHVTADYVSGVKSLPGVVVPTLSLHWSDPDCWLGVNSQNLLDDLPVYIVEVIAAASAAQAKKRYWKCEIFDALNVDGYVEMPRLMAGLAFRPARNYDENNQVGLEALTDPVEMLAGNFIYGERGIRRTLQLSFPNLTPDEGFGSVFRMMVLARDSRQVFVIPEYSDNNFLQERSFLATCKTVPAIAQGLSDTASTKFDLLEVI